MKAGNPTGTYFPVSQSCYHILYFMMSFAKLCCAVISLTVTLWLSSMSATTFWSLCSVVAHLAQPQNGWLTVSVFPLSYTAGTHADIFVRMKKLPIDVCRWVVFFHKKFSYCTLVKGYIFVSHFVTVFAWISPDLYYLVENRCHYWYYILCSAVCVIWLLMT
jgi:hypothetical protein